MHCSPSESSESYKDITPENLWEVCEALQVMFDCLCLPTSVSSRNTMLFYFKFVNLLALSYIVHSVVLHCPFLHDNV